MITKRVIRTKKFLLVKAPHQIVERSGEVKARIKIRRSHILHIGHATYHRLGFVFHTGTLDKPLYTFYQRWGDVAARFVNEKRFPLIDKNAKDPAQKGHLFLYVRDDGDWVDIKNN